MSFINPTIRAFKVRGTIKPVAHFVKQGNIKLGERVWHFSTLNRADMYVIVDGNGKKYSVFGTCAHYCDGCAGSCYVNKSYRYDSVVKCHAENTIAIVTDIKKAFRDLEKQIRRARKKPSKIRINQSGELISKEMFCEFQKLARKFPAITFWLYTKAYDLIVEDVADTPRNMFINYSVWHENGITEYFDLRARSKQVAAFVYCDGYDYSKHGLKIDVMCPAYNKDGKMDHSKTCNKCGLCMLGGGLTIGCYNH